MIAVQGVRLAQAAVVFLLLSSSFLIQAQEKKEVVYKPPCAQGINYCNAPRKCFVCTNDEYQVASNGYGGYPIDAQCSAMVENCLYCWKQVEKVTFADGWSSEYQYKSCVPWALADKCRGDERACIGQYAHYSIDYCQTQVQEKTVEACADGGGWCTKTTTECACSKEGCNAAGRVGVHNMMTSVFLAAFLALFLRKCVAA